MLDVARAIAEGMAEELRSDPQYAIYIRVNHYRDMKGYRRPVEPNALLVGSVPHEGNVARVEVDGEEGRAYVWRDQVRDDYCPTGFDLNDPEFPDCLYRHLVAALCPIPKLILC